jgi:hypothetical protein
MGHGERPNKAKGAIVKEIAKKLAVWAWQWGAGSWLRGLLIAMVLGAVGGGAVYVSSGEGAQVKAGIEEATPSIQVQ